MVSQDNSNWNQSHYSRLDWFNWICHEKSQVFPSNHQQDLQMLYLAKLSFFRHPVASSLFQDILQNIKGTLNAGYKWQGWKKQNWQRKTKMLPFVTTYCQHYLKGQKFLLGSILDLSDSSLRLGGNPSLFCAACIHYIYNNVCCS